MRVRNRWTSVGIGFSLLVFASVAAATDRPKCSNEADRLLSEAGFPTLAGTFAPNVETILAGAALELARERYRSGKHPEYRWLDSEPKKKSDSVRIFKHDRERAVVFAVGDENAERITQVSIQGRRYGTEGAATTEVRFNAKCQVIAFVTDPQDLGHPTRDLKLSPKGCVPVLDAEERKQVPKNREKFTLEAAKKLLPRISEDDPTMLEALEVAQDTTYVKVVHELFQAKLALCRDWLDTFYDPGLLLKKWEKLEMRDRPEGGNPKRTRNAK